MPGLDDNRKVYAVGELTRLIRHALESSFGTVWLEGEVSNLRRPASGHLYFTLKDAESQIQAVMFWAETVPFLFEGGCLLTNTTAMNVYGPFPLAVETS